MTHEDAPERTHDGIGHQPCLVRDHRDHQRRLIDGESQVAAQRAEMAALRDTGPARRRAGEYRHESRDRDRAEHEHRPEQRRGARPHPSGDQGEEDARHRQGAPEIVDHLPAADDGDAPCRSREQLPIPRARGAGARRTPGKGRRGLEELVSVTSRRGEQALEQIVAQQRVFGDAAASAASKASTS